MSLVDSNRSLRLRISHLLVLVALTLVIGAVDIRMIRARGLQSEAAHAIELAERILHEGRWYPTAFYPPLPTWIAMGVFWLGAARIDPFALNLILLILGLLPAYQLALRVCHKEWLAFAACGLVLLNPYFVWTVLLSRDSALEFFCLGIVLWSAVRLLESEEAMTSIRRWAALLTAGAIALALARVTGYFMGLAVVLAACLISRSLTIRRALLACGIGLLVFGGAWAYSNYRQVGAFALATNGGYNLYLGNHPAFLHGYPHYDLDVFLRSQDLSRLQNSGEAESNAGYTRAALDYIRADPPAFVYRTIMKSAWYWFSLDKLPNYTSNSQVISPPSDTNWTANLDTVSILPSLAYVLYRLGYLPGLLAVVIAMQRGLLHRAYIVLLAPMLGLWPIVALTFPDTRFKLSAEALTVPLVVAGAWALWSSTRGPQAGDREGADGLRAKGGRDRGAGEIHRKGAKNTKR